jgi:DNA-binding MarR family transcriptional regulator
MKDNNNAEYSARIESVLFAMKRMAFQKRTQKGEPGLFPPSIFMMLSILGKHYKNNRTPITASELAEQMNVSISAVTQILNTLENKGAISRVKSQSDRRVTNILLTRRGCFIVKHINRRLRRQDTSVLSELLGYLGPADSAELTRLIERIGDFLQQQNSKKERGE